MNDQVHQIAAGLGRLAAFGRACQWQAGVRLGLNPTQAEILLRITERPQRAVNLAAHLGVSPASLSDSIAALVAKGLALRGPDPDDRRARLVSATPLGRQIAAQIPATPHALSEAIGALPHADRENLLTSLMRIIRDLQQARAIPVQRMCVTCRHFRPHAHDDAAAPHHCDFVNAAFGDGALRLDCGDHEAAPSGEAAAIWRQFAAT
jgi:DNA-binding MarR family transcriptional regulator